MRSSTTDTNGGVTFLNPVAQSLTGWTQADAAGLDIVFGCDPPRCIAMR